MAIYHHAFAFDADNFHRAVEPLVLAVNAGDLQALHETAYETVKGMSQLDPILYDIGAALPHPEEIDKVNFAPIPKIQSVEGGLGQLQDIHPGDIGFWFLLVLTKYLGQSSGIGPDHTLLEGALKNLGWRGRDIERLILGEPCCTLVGHDCIRKSFRSHHDPYWHWIVPRQAKSSGWLSNTDVARLYEKICSTESLIRDYDPQFFPNPWNLIGEDLLDSQRDFSRRLNDSYKNASRMLEQAKKKDSGLFMVMVY